MRATGALNHITEKSLIITNGGEKFHDTGKGRTSNLCRSHIPSTVAYLKCLSCHRTLFVVFLSKTGAWHLLASHIIWKYTQRIKDKANGKYFNYINIQWKVNREIHQAIDSDTWWNVCPSIELYHHHHPLDSFFTHISYQHTLTHICSVQDCYSSKIAYVMLI